METPTEKAERLAAITSTVTGGPVGLAGCGCPNRVDGSPPLLHICRTCGLEGSRESAHADCAGAHG